jgi:DNA polymerase III sliding clamp (beta) subunit (PCNA family)
MKKETILKELNLIGSRYSDHAKKIIDLYKFVESIKQNITSVKTVFCDLNFGQYSTSSGWNSDPTIYDGEIIPGMAIEINANFGKSSGVYNIVIPTETKIFEMFLELLPVQKNEFLNTEVQNSAIEKIKIPLEALSELKKVVKFADVKSGYKENLKTVLFEICDNKIKFVATDAHTLYSSVQFDVIAKDQQILINRDVLMDVLQSKPKELIINIFEDRKTINNLDFDDSDLKYPQYRNVIPEAETFMEFDKKELVNLIKQVQIAGNKYCKKMNFHLNGAIEASVEDIDFGNQASSKIPYISKNFKDSDIGFNTELFKKSLVPFSAKNLKMFTDGSKSKAVKIASDDDSFVILMPIII